MNFFLSKFCKFNAAPHCSSITMIAATMITSPAVAEDAKQFTKVLVDQYDKLRQSDPKFQEKNLQMVRDIMSNTTQVRKDLAVRDNATFNMANMMDRAKGGLDAGLFSGIGGENANPFMNSGDFSPGKLHEYGKGMSNSPRPCAASLSGHIMPLFGCSTSSSYPSGHTAKATGASLLAAYLFPERFQPFIARAQEYGESRIVAGQHYALDVMASRVMAYKAVADLLAQQSQNPTSWLNTAANPERIRQNMVERCGGMALQACADKRTDSFSDHDRNKAFYNYTKYYRFAPIGPTDKPMIVPENAEYLIQTRFPYLSADQLREIIRTTSDPSGQILDDPWSRINLFAAADGYGRFDTDVSVTMDMTKAANQAKPGAGYNATDIWRNDIGGTGRLTKAGGGALTLTGTNSFGGFTLQAGTLTLTGTNTLTGSSNTTGGQLVLDHGSLSTRGDLSVSDNTKLSLQAASISASGQLDVAATTVLQGSAAITVGQGRMGSISGTINGGGGLVKRGDGRLLLAGANSFLGDVKVEKGTLALGTSTAAGKGDIILADQTTLAYIDGINVKNRLVLEGGGNLDVATGRATQSGTIGGSGNFRISGAGILDITGDFSGFGGTTRISGTTVVANNAFGGKVAIADGGVFIANGPTIATVEVEKNGTLKGLGSVGTTTIGTGGVIAPGNSPGTITILGDLTFKVGATYQVEVSPSGENSDFIKVSGLARIDGGNVQHVGLDGNYAPFVTYRILSADGGVQGRFDTVTSNYTFLTPNLVYSANAIDLTLVRNRTTYASVAVTRNQKSVANALDSAPEANAVSRNLATLNPPSARVAFDSLSGDIHSSIVASLQEETKSIRTVVSERSHFGVDSAKATLMSNSDGKSLSDDSSSTVNTSWGYTFGNFGSRKGNDSTIGVDTSGLLVGADIPFMQNARLGIIGGYSHSTYDAGSRSGSANSDSYHIGLYSSTKVDGILLSGGTAYSWHQITNQRSTSVGDGLVERVRGDYHGRTFQIFGEVSRPFTNHVASLEPFVGVAYVRTGIDNFQEEGGLTTLSFPSQSIDTTFSTIGLRNLSTFSIGQTEAALRATVGWRHAFGDRDASLIRQFSSGPNFSIAGAPIAEDAILITGGFDFQVNRNTKIGVAYNGQFGGGTRSNGLNVKLNASF